MPARRSDLTAPDGAEDNGSSILPEATRGARVTKPGLVIGTWAIEQGWATFFVSDDKVPFMGTHGHLDATKDPARLAEMARGRRANMVAVAIDAGAVVIDVDAKPEFSPVEDRLRNLGLRPEDADVHTPRGGFHFYFLAEDGVTLRNGVLEGVDVKTIGGFVVAPGSNRLGVGPYVGELPRRDALRRMPDRTREALLAGYARRGSSGLSIERGESLIGGYRHDAFRDAAYQLGTFTNLDPPEIHAALLEINRTRTFPPYSTRAEMRELADLARKAPTLPPPPVFTIRRIRTVVAGSAASERAPRRPKGYAPRKVRPTGEDASSLIIGIDAYRASVPSVVPWAARPLVYYGGVTLVAGPPKGGKSTIVSNLERCRETRDLFLGAWHVATGPTLLVTEESGVAVIYKTHGLSKLDVLDRRAAVRAGLTFGGVLALIAEWSAANPRGLVVIDTLAIWAGIEDENDASEATRRIAEVMVLAATTNLAVILVHHTRKGGGEHGEGIRGSSALFATVDIAAELNYVAKGSDRRHLDVFGRVIEPVRFLLDFDRATKRYYLVDTETAAEDEAEADIVGIPSDGPGLSRDDLEALWGYDPRKRIAELMDLGRLRGDKVKVGRTKAWRYWGKGDEHLAAGDAGEDDRDNHTEEIADEGDGDEKEFVDEADDDADRVAGDDVVTDDEEVAD
jgi:AAA domain/Bifunctional DNA primase/polymerase, N-terminal